MLLPLDPDASARRLRDALRGAPPRSGVIITDSFGRPFRLGTTGVAVGLRRARAGARAHGRDATTPGACCRAPSCTSPTRSPRPPSSCSGPFGGVPAAVVRGVAFDASDAARAPGLMPAERDLFRDAADALSRVRA